MPPRPISQVAFYLFSPCLAYNLIVNSEVSMADILRMFGFGMAGMLLVGLLAWAAGRALRLDRRLLAAVMITSMFMNAGNYGLPVVNFAFGETALAFAVPYFVSMAILTNTFGVFTASMGTMNARQAVLGVLRMPVIYAVGAALLFKSMGWALPLPAERSVTILGNAAIPTMLVLLGLQFQAARWTGQFKPLFLVVALRLLAAPLISLFLAPLFSLQGFAFQAGVLESAMPTAVMTAILATEFDVEPSFVAFVVFISTLLSPLTLTPLLYFLGAK